MVNKKIKSKNVNPEWEKCKIELLFLGKCFRNVIVLAVIYFCSIWTTTSQLDFNTHWKPIIIFVLGYVAAELANRWGIKKIKSEVASTAKTFIF